MPREITTFPGRNVVIGCTATHRRCPNRAHPHYYSIDMDETYDPDYRFDIRETLPDTFKNRFHITYTENLDFYAYNDPLPNTPSSAYIANAKGAQGFKNLWDMTQEDGFIFINGCPRQQEFRNSIQTLKYVEISICDKLNGNGVVLIPKNQTLSIEEVNEKIKNDEDIRSLIEKLNASTGHPPIPSCFPLSFCPISFDCMENFKIINKNMTEKQKDQALLYLKGVIVALDALCPAEMANSFNALKKAWPEVLENIIPQDITTFKTACDTFFASCRGPIIQKNFDYFLLALNICIGLTIVGAIIIAAYALYTQRTSGRPFPLFFAPSPLEEYRHREIEKIHHEIENLQRSCKFLQSYSTPPIAPNK